MKSKFLKLNFLWIVVLACTFGSCEKENFNATISGEEIETENITKNAPICNINFARNLNYSITLVNNQDNRRTFTIPKRKINISDGFATLQFDITPKRRNQAFFKAGIKSYIFTSNNPLDKEVEAGSIVVTRRNEFVSQGSAVFKKGQRLRFRSSNIDQRIRKNIDNIQITFGVNREPCFL